MYNVCFTLGDPGGDGHASTSDYHMESNYSAEEIDAAYDKATDILGFDFVDKVGSQWEETQLEEPYFSILVEKGVINRKDFEFEYNGQTTFDNYLDEYNFINIFTKICQLVLPDLFINSRDLQESCINSLEGAAYGIAYHGE